MAGDSALGIFAAAWMRTLCMYVVRSVKIQYLQRMSFFVVNFFLHNTSYLLMKNF